MRRLAAPVAAAVLLVIAAAGLSSEAVDDYCITRGPAVNEEFDGTSSSPIILWPPGPQCRYETASGKVIGTENLGDVAGFTIMLAVGALAVSDAAATRGRRWSCSDSPDCSPCTSASRR